MSQIKTISIDIETYSDVDLQKCGVYKYVQSDSFEILLFGYSVDGGEVSVVDLKQGEKIPMEIIMALTDENITKWAFNANFERVCLSEYLRRFYPKKFVSYSIPEDSVGNYLDPSSWKCSMVWSAYMGLPLLLAGAGAVLGLALIWSSAVKFGKKVQSQVGYVSPEEFNKGFSLKPDDYSDIGQAKVLSREYAGELVFTDSTDYMRYDGTHWAESKQMAVGACEEFLDEQLKEAIAAVEKAKKMLLDAGIDKDTVMAGGKALEKAIDEGSEKAFKEFVIASKYYAFVMKRRDMKFVTSALQAAKPMLLKKIADFDSQEFLLNAPDATYDLQDGSSKEHAAADLITKMTAVSPSTEGMDLWKDALDSFFCCDKELIDYVQQIVGLSAIGKVYVEALVIAYGEGSNGSS